jgi:hypothetical protein
MSLIPEQKLTTWNQRALDLKRTTPKDTLTFELAREVVALIRELRHWQRCYDGVMSRIERRGGAL